MRLLLIAIMVLLMSPAAHSMDSWMHTLMNAHEFSDGVVGEAPEPSAPYVAYREALIEPTSVTDQQIDQLLAKATPAGRVYAACLWYYAHTSRKQLADRDNAFKRLALDSAAVFYRSGCRGTNSTVGEISSALLKERHFLNFALTDLSELKSTHGIPDSLLRLSRANRLESDVVGEGANSASYAWYREASRVPRLRANGMELYWLLHHGTPAGRLYAAFLAMQLDPASGKRMFERLKEDTDKVDYQSGCEVMTYTVGAVAKDVLGEGKFADFPIKSTK